MKSNFIKVVTVLAFVALFSNKGAAQIEVMQNYVFSHDSVAGFDEQAASAAAFGGGFYGDEFKVFMYKEKRVFIKNKYNLPTITADPTTLFQNPVSLHKMSVTGACDNEDFELATTDIVAPAAVQGWTLQSGTNPNGCQPPTLSGTNLYTVYAGPSTDVKLPFQVTSFFDANTNTTPAGNSYIRLNNLAAGATCVRMSKSFVPTSASALFQYAYLSVIQDGCHACCDQAGFDIKVAVTNTANNTTSVLACPNISIAVPSGTNCGSYGCSFTVSPGGPVFVPAVGGAGWVYCPWTQSAIDLTQYIGSPVTIIVTVRDCDAGGHTGYTYFDAKCSPMTIFGNNNPFPAGSTNVTLPTCGPNGATMCATPGLGPFTWEGPAVPASYGVPSMTNACFITSVSATYTLNMNPPGSCVPIKRVITTTITPAPLLVISAVQAVCGNTLATISVTPSGSATNPSFINWSPVPLTLNTQTTVATYTIPPGPASTTIYVTASDPIGCQITATAVVNPSAPAPSVTVVNNTGTYSLTCATPSIDLSVTTSYTYGTLDYVWQSSSFSYSTSNVNINTTNSAPYTITLTATDPITLCSDKKVITISTNTVHPLSSITPTYQTLSCGGTATTVTLTATNPTVNIGHVILDPFGGTFSTTAIQAIYPPGPGTYTHFLTNLVNGCVTVKQFTVFPNDSFPRFNLSSSPPGYTLGCTTTSVTTVTINNAQHAGGGAVSYTILAPGQPNPPASGLLGSISSYSINAPGTYTVITRGTGDCDTRIAISVTSNTFGPSIDTVLVPRRVLDCFVPTTTLTGVSKTENVSYNWTFPGTPGNQAGDTLGVTVDFTKPTATLIATYTLTVKNNNSTCISTTLVPVFQNLFKPIAKITGALPLTCNVPTVQLSNFSSANPNIPSAFPSTGRVAGLLWEGPSPQIPQSNSTSYLAFFPGVYTLTAQDLDNGCTSVTTTTILDNRVYPIFSIQNDTVECGSAVVLKPTVTSGSTGLTYEWTAPPNVVTSDKFKNVLTTETPGEYNVMITNTVNGCVSTGSVAVMTGTLIAEILADNTTGYAPLTVNFTNNSHTATNDTSKIMSVWSYGNGTTNTVSTRAPRSVVYNQPGTYTVTLYVAKGTCIEKIQKVIQVEVPSSIKIPNVFTPNNDGVNDLFFLKTSNLSEVNAVIYDRWGHLVYKLDSESNIAWDGKNQAGQECSEGTYFYIIKAKGKDGVNYEDKGTISLFR